MAEEKHVLSTGWVFPDDERHALTQGWSLFAADNGSIVIQKMDDPVNHGLWEEGMIEECPFESDNAAIRKVRRLARQGDAVAQKAIAIHDKHYAAWSQWRRRGLRKFVEYT